MGIPIGEKCVGLMELNLAMVTKFFHEQTCIVWANPNLQWAVLRNMETGCGIFSCAFKVTCDKE